MKMIAQTVKQKERDKMNKELEELVKKDCIAVEMARRKKVFHNNEKWNINSN